MSKERGLGFLIKWIIFLIDLVVINLTFLIVHLWMIRTGGPHFSYQFRIVILLLNFCYLFSLYFIPIRIYIRIIPIDKVIQGALSLISLHAILFITCLVFLYKKGLPHHFLFIYYGILFFVFTNWRIIARTILKYYRKVGYNFKRVIIIGTGDVGLELYREMVKDCSAGYRVLGFFDESASEEHEVKGKYIGTTDRIESYCIEKNVDEVYCTLSGSNHEVIKRIMNFCEKNMIRFYLVPEYSQYIKKTLILNSISSIPVLAVRTEPLQYIHNRMLKRMLDILFSFIFLTTLFPFIYLIIGFLIKLSSPGPVLFRQKRTGLYGKQFYCYKFRSMIVNQEADIKQAEKNDPRNTRIGEFIRKTNIDEMPQFINVLLGNMSIVGPRPHMLCHTALYSSLIDKYMVRHLVKPGVTGWAQINGFRGETKTVEQMEERVKHDVWYLENWNFLLDLKIIFRTAMSMFKRERKNAY